METQFSLDIHDSLAPTLLQLQQLRRAVAHTPAEAAMVDSLEVQLRSLESVVNEQHARWVVLHGVSTRLARELDHESLLKEIVRSSAELLRARGGGLILRDFQSGKFTVQVVYAAGRFRPELTGRRLEPNEGLMGRVVATDGPVILADYSSWDGRLTGYERLHLKSVLAVPLVVEQTVAGALMIGERPAPFTEDDVQTLTLFAQQAAAALERARTRQNAAALVLSEERSRLARELHDGLAQDLATLMLKADLCRDLAVSSDPALEAELDRLADGLQQAVRETRAAVLSYQRSTSTGQCLIDALRLSIARFQAHTRVPATLTWTGDLAAELPSGYHTALVRVAQEALTNVRKHARASEVELVVDFSRPNTLELSVHDNGCGFEPREMAAGSDGHGLGLCSMRSRVEELGGGLRIDASVGCGATVTATLPQVHRGVGGHE